MTNSTAAAMTYTKRVANNLRVALIVTDKSQKQLATALSRSDDWVSRRVLGKTAMSTDEISEVAAFLGVHPTALTDTIRPFSPTPASEVTA